MKKPILVSKTDELKKILSQLRQEGKIISFVPTMGYLHEGHLELMRRAKKHSDYCVISIFVNPTQFAPGEDFDRYPRDPEGDYQKAASVGVDLIYSPTTEQIYPQNSQTFVEVTELSKPLCGAHREGHFRGVTTVVAKLFNIVRPHKAFFGQKDFQQLQIIRQMVRDLFFDIEIIGVPTVREPDGLALSSRNVYLSPDERKAARSLSQSIKKARELFQSGERDPQKIESEARKIVESEPLAKPQYIELRDPQTLERVRREVRPDDRLFLAVFVGKARLIDNGPMRGEWGIFLDNKENNST